MTPIGKRFYKDSALVYRRNAKTPGRPETYSQVGSAVACNWHATDNFDEPKSDATLAKTQNVQTSDYVTCDRSAGIQAEDVLQLTDRNGGVQWVRVAGARKIRNLLNYSQFYITPCGDAPVIV